MIECDALENQLRNGEGDNVGMGGFAINKKSFYGVKNMPVDTIISACLVLRVAKFLIKVLAMVSSDINSFCSVASLAAAIIIAYVQYRQARQQQKSEEERNLKEDRVRIENIESEVTRFLQKYNSSGSDEDCSELCLLPLCVMASKYNEIFPYRRKIYRDFCALTPDVQKAILVRTKLDYDIKQEPKFFDKCVNAISDAVKRYSPNDRDWFYDNGKFLSYAIKLFGGDKVPSYMCKADEEVERHNAYWNDNQTKMSFEDHIINLIKYSRMEKPIEQLLEEEIWETDEDDKTKIISNTGKWTIHESDKAIAFLFCMIAMYLPLQFRKEYLSTGRECIDDYPKDDLYMEDLFLKALHTIYVYLIHYDYYSRVDFF